MQTFSLSLPPEIRAHRTRSAREIHMRFDYISSQQYGSNENKEKHTHIWMENNLESTDVN